MFYNTGIGTFIWILSNNKAEHRKGKIQLIDATSLKSPLRKNLGKKNCEFTSEIRRQILDLYMAFEENEYSKIFDNNEFGYWKVTVLRPAYNEDGTIQKIKRENLLSIKSQQIQNKYLLPMKVASKLSLKKK